MTGDIVMSSRQGRHKSDTSSISQLKLSVGVMLIVVALAVILLAMIGFGFAV